jgi:hypothetical protein
VQISNYIPEVISNFQCSAQADNVQPYGSGHINDSFLVKNITAGGPDYLLQRINNSIFTNVEALTGNMLRVTEHLKNKISSENGDPLKAVMTLIPTRNNQYYYLDSGGNYWRMLYFLKNTRSYDMVSTEKQAYEGGKAFGRFQSMLADFPSNELFEVLPNFHNIEFRLGQLKEAIASNLADRLETVPEELALVKAHADDMLYFQQPERLATLPKRVTHNDTKFNNVLLDQNDEAQCVIDLETVMQGYVAYDFGDAIRTIINTAAEDEADLEKIQLNMPLFRAYTRGYLEHAANFLTEQEIESLVKGVLLFPYMQGVRFLTDHLNGDTYYKIKFPNHNLQRTRAQFQLFRNLHKKAAEIQQIIQKEISNLKTSQEHG